ncbi:MAG: bacillithiol biosynthesis cysteine-adding enzyme BshC [Bacteroidetes bacterium]|nr:bacillithiol biosynthesis cysteine-adding enzyme BshC [Bacteroidota bacterium]
MPEGISYLPYSDTGHFSHLVTDYLAGKPELQPFYSYCPDKEGLLGAIAERSKYPVDRESLVRILAKQYTGLVQHEAVSKNIELLRQENTFTVCTAHQPNLLTGYLYFIYKIVHAIRLAEELKRLQPDKDFVPVYYIGSEDNDLDELGTFRYGDNKFVWDGGGQKGAVGRMSTKTLKPVLDELFKLLGPPGDNCETLKKLLTQAYLQQPTIAKATQYLVNELFGRFGLIVLDPDEAGFKQAILPVLQDDLLNGNAYTIVNAQATKLSEHYKVQANPRPINLFYLKDDIRERIERSNDRWEVLNTAISWNEAELLAELQEHPERFSPNVILRGILQESILPDVAFIGGGAEVAYWLQLKPLFEHYKVFYPAIVLRQSVMWVNEVQRKQLQALGIGPAEIFQPEEELAKEYINRNSSDDWHTNKEDVEIEGILAGLKEKATAIDPTLSKSAAAALTKIKYQLEVLEKKMLRAQKRKMQVQLDRITRIKGSLFPNGGLQERVENFLSYFLKYGHGYFDILKGAIDPLKAQFLIVEE